MQDLTLPFFQVDEAREYIDEIMFYVRDQFVDGRISTAKALVMDCVIVTQNRHCIAQLDKAAYGERGLGCVVRLGSKRKVVNLCWVVAWRW